MEYPQHSHARARKIDACPPDHLKKGTWAVTFFESACGVTLHCRLFILKSLRVRLYLIQRRRNLSLREIIGELVGRSLELDELRHGLDRLHRRALGLHFRQIIAPRSCILRQYHRAAADLVRDQPTGPDFGIRRCQADAVSAGELINGKGILQLRLSVRHGAFLLGAAARGLLAPKLKIFLDARLTAACGRQGFPLSRERPLTCGSQDGGFSERHDRHCANFVALANSPGPTWTPLFTCGPQDGGFPTRHMRTTNFCLRLTG